MDNRVTGNIWIISEGRFVNLDLTSICDKPVAGPVTEYKISELAKYLLNPNSITVEEKVVGCKVKYRLDRSGKLAKIFKKIFPKANSASGTDDSPVEEIISTSKIGTPSFPDDDFNKYLIKLNEQLRPFDPVQKKLSMLKKDKIEDIIAVCEDISGSKYQLNLQGTVNDKLNYIVNSVSKQVKVVFNKAYLTNGLFELRGFNFSAFNPDLSYKLIKFTQNNQIRYCVLNSAYQLEYWVSDTELVNYLHIFDQSVKTDLKLKEVVSQCIKGDVKPLKLFFSRKLDQHYSEKYLPVTYRKIFDIYEMNLEEKKRIANILNNHQSIVSFNYVPKYEAGKQRIFINISVLHDIKALEPIRSTIPQLYSEITKQAPSSDAGRLYLLDSMRGYQYV